MNLYSSCYFPSSLMISYENELENSSSGFKEMGEADYNKLFSFHFVTLKFEFSEEKYQ